MRCSSYAGILLPPHDAPAHPAGTRDNRQFKQGKRHSAKMTMMKDDLDERIRSGQALSESMGNFHVTGWNAQSKTLGAAFTVRREYCHTNGTIAQGGFITAWLDAAMAHAVMHETGHTQTVFSLEIKVSF